jgi:GNAT superfamily N-acetyltransferase
MCIELKTPFIEFEGFEEDRFIAEHTKRILESRFLVLVAEEEGQIIGFLSGGYASYPYGITRVVGCDCVYVLPEYRNKGVFEKLVEEGSKWALGEGALYLEVLVPKERTKYYQKKGFEPHFMRMVQKLEVT